MKNNEMIWSMLLHLGSNMWRKDEQEFCSPSYKDYEDDFVFRKHMHCDREVWRKVTEFLPECGINTVIVDVGDGVVLDSHPEIAVDGAWTKDEMRADIKRMRELGLEVIPKCNFSCGHSAWMKEYAYMVGTETYYKFCDDVVAELIELFDTPRFFHLGLEEEDAESQKNQPIATVRAPYIKMRDALRLFDVCISRGVRPWIWTDQRTIDAFGGDEIFRKKMPKEVLHSNWYYGIIRDAEGVLENHTAAKTIKKLADWGMDQVPTCSTWSWHLNAKDTLRICSKYIDKNSIKGYMMAPWQLTHKNKYYSLLDAAYTLGVAKDMYYGEE